MFCFVSEYFLIKVLIIYGGRVTKISNKKSVYCFVLPVYALLESIPYALAVHKNLSHALPLNYAVGQGGKSCGNTLAILQHTLAIFCIRTEGVSKLVIISLVLNEFSYSKGQIPCHFYFRLCGNIKLA